MASISSKNLLEMTKDEKRKFIDSFDYILSDCDGVLWKLTEFIDGVGKAISKLQENGKKIYYCTNNSMKFVEDFIDDFKQNEINATCDEIVHPGSTVVLYLKKIKFEGLIYVLGSKNLVNTIRAGGFDVIEGPSDPVEQKISSFLKGVTEKKNVKAVMVDTDLNLNYRKFLSAEFYLKNPDCIFLAGATDCIIGLTSTFQLIGPGQFLQLLEDNLNRKAIVVGKPGLGLKEILLETYKFPDPNRVLFIGDMLEQDVGFGKLCGFQTLFVLSGSTSIDKLMKHTNIDEIPNYYTNAITDFSIIFKELDC